MRRGRCGRCATVDETGALRRVRAWEPYGVEMGEPQAGLGFTGEWYDPGLGMLYLRARWYAPRVGIFSSPDPFPGLQTQPRSLHPYLYVLANPVNGTDPSGLCALTGATDCERFVSELRCMIKWLRDARKCNIWLSLVSEEALVLDLLAWYYSGIPFNWQGLYLGWIPQRSTFLPGDPDRWTVPVWEQGRYDWNHPIGQRESDLGRTMRQIYGFKRPYFEQTHHYFAFLKFAYHWGGLIVEWMHKQRELEDQIRPAFKHWREEHPDEPDYSKWYAWVYRESVYDLYIVNEATKLALAISLCGADVIPDYIEHKWCAASEADVWSLENEVDQFYFDFPSEYWPEEQFWPGR